jgi:DNA-binding beta-propeller fold protein YncE
VTPIRTATGKALPAIRVAKPTTIGYGTYAIAITPDGKTAYVLSTSGVTPIDTATGKAGQAISVRGLDLQAIAITPNGKTAYVISRQGIVPISTATSKAGKTIRVQDLLDPAGIVITPDGTTAYLLNNVSEPPYLPGFVIPIWIAAGTVGQPIQAGNGPVAIALTP